MDLSVSISELINKSISNEFYGKKKINIFQEYKNCLRTNYLGVRIVKPNSPISRIRLKLSSLLNFSISSLFSKTRSLANSLTIFSISPCSSENCSLVNMECSPIGCIRKQPPVLYLFIAEFIHRSFATRFID